MPRGSPVERRQLTVDPVEAIQQLGMPLHFRRGLLADERETAAWLKGGLTPVAKQFLDCARVAAAASQ